MMNQSPPQQGEATLQAMDYWQVIKNRYGIILLTLFLVFMTALIITLLLTPKYDSEARFEVRSKSGIMPFGESMKQAGGRESAKFFGTEFEKITSANSLGKVAEKLGLASRWSVDQEQAIQILKGIVTTRIIRDTTVVAVKARHQDKETARDIATEVVAAYKNYRSDIESSDTNQVLLELNKEIREQEDKVEERKRILSKIIETTNIVYTGEGQQRVDEERDIGLKMATQSYHKLGEDKAKLESQIKSLSTYSSEELLLFTQSLDLPENIVRTLYPQYLEAQRELESSKLEGLADQHHMIRAQKSRISSMKEQLDNGVVSVGNTLKANLGIIEEELSKLKDIKEDKKEESVKGSMAAQAFLDAKTDFETDQKILEQLRLKLIAESISAKVSEDSIVVHEPPKIARVASTPNYKLNLILGAVVGLIFGVGIAFFLEYLDTSVKSLEDVERYLQVPVLAVIPKDVGVLHKQGGMSPDAEAYRILRTNIEFNRKNPEDNAITVVSGGAGEGKSTTLVNLAYICAQGGYTTLMIDADLRRPRLHTFFDINNSVGLTNYLTTELMLEDVILQTPVDNLYFMPSGILPSDAAGILNSRRMSELVQDVKQRFDLVLIDSPPILGVSDASVLASEVDLTMIVVQHRKLPRNMLIRVKQAVENVGGHVIGVVLNNVDVRSDSQYQYYTSYYTYYAPAEAQSPQPAAPKASAAPVKAKSESRGGDSDLY